METTDGGFFGSATGLSVDGALIVRDADGAERRVLAGKTSIREAGVPR